MPQPPLCTQSLTDPALLKSHFGDIGTIDVRPIDTAGYSGARFSQIFLILKSGKNEHLILKEVELADDWFSHRTKDKVGREAAALVEPGLAEIADIFSSPYRLVQMEAGKIGLLMDDLSTGLFPDEKKPLSMADQDLILEKLSVLHATYWNSEKLEPLNWLHNTADFIYLMGPLDHIPFEGGSAKNIQIHIKNGWEATLPLLPSSLRERLLRSPAEIAADWDDLPKTLVHGDTKVANFAKDPNGELCLLDWAFAGYAPCTFDLGWFIAVNASRLAETKEAVLNKYRNMLEKQLGHSLEDHLWNRLEEAGIVCGAFMLLWSKGAAIANAREGATAEWNWWLDRLEAWV